MNKIALANLALTLFATVPAHAQGAEQKAALAQSIFDEADEAMKAKNDVPAMSAMRASP